MTDVKWKLPYEGVLPDGVTIKFGTDVWLQEGEEPVDLQWILDHVPEARASVGHCEGCRREFIDGVFAPVNDDISIGMCDECGIFEGDLEAAQALATHLEKVLGKEPGSLRIWYIPSTYEGDEQ